MSETTLNLQQPWPVVSERIKEANVEITDDDLRFVEGHEGELLNRLSKKTGMSLNEVKGWIESLSANEGKAS